MINEKISLHQKEIKTLNRKSEINWFQIDKSGRHSQFEMEDLTIPNKNKTKIIASVNKDFDKEIFRKLFDDGYRSFRIDGSTFSFKEYNQIVKDIYDIYLDNEEIPNVFFDLKGPLPHILKIGNCKNMLKVKKGDIVKIKWDIGENNVIEEEDDEEVIYIDKNISNGVHAGDTLIINSSQVKLKVIDRQNTKINLASETSFTRNNCLRRNSSPFLNLVSSNANTKTIFNSSDKKSKPMVQMVRKEFRQSIFHEEEVVIDATNFDNHLEEKLKNRHRKMTQVYNNFIKRHSGSSNKELLEIEKIMGMSQLKGPANFPKVESAQTPRKKSSNSISRGLDTCLICEVAEEGKIFTETTLNIMDKDIIRECEIPILSTKDIFDLHKAYELGINTFSILVNSADNIDEINDILGKEIRENIKLFARIETHNSINNFDMILMKVDGIVIQRGLIYSALPLEELSLVEIYMIEKCKINNKLIILQNLSLHLINVSKPAISKISSLDFAVREGIDSVIIEEETSGETFINTIDACRDVVLQCEMLEDNRNKHEEMCKNFSINRIKENKIVESFLENAAKLSHDLKAELIILFTDNLIFSKTLSNYRPLCLIALPTSQDRDIKFIRVLRGVSPFKCQEKDILSSNFEQLIKNVYHTFINKNVIPKDSEKIIVVNAFVNLWVKNKNSLLIINTEMLK